MKILRRILGALLFLFFLLAISFSLLFKSKLGGPDYIELLERVSGNRLVCNSQSGGITLFFKKQDLSIEVDASGRKTKLAYEGSHDFTDYFKGLNGEIIEIDPEIKLSSFEEGLGGLCWEE